MDCFFWSAEKNSPGNWPLMPKRLGVGADFIFLHHTQSHPVLSLAVPTC